MPYTINAKYRSTHAVLGVALGVSLTLTTLAAPGPQLTVVVDGLNNPRGAL